MSNNNVPNTEKWFIFKNPKNNRFFLLIFILLNLQNRYIKWSNYFKYNGLCESRWFWTSYIARRISFYHFPSSSKIGNRAVFISRAGMQKLRSKRSLRSKFLTSKSQLFDWHFLGRTSSPTDREIFYVKFHVKNSTQMRGKRYSYGNTGNSAYIPPLNHNPTFDVDIIKIKTWNIELLVHSTIYWYLQWIRYTFVTRLDIFVKRRYHCE